MNVIDTYIKQQPEEVQPVLKKLHAIFRAAAPETTEGISYGIPTFYLNGKYLVYFAGFKHHISVYPATTTAVEKVEGLSAYKVSTGTLKFPLNKPIPYDLIEQFVRLRLLEENANQKEKKSEGK